ncbi:MAG: hypothetical protein M1818_003808 [Claussenomyces sp. TS43310]|nr:MAG: hypothetical protein M1818_003808 [Claussenomyces sp. TS43310]
MSVRDPPIQRPVPRRPFDFRSADASSPDLSLPPSPDSLPNQLEAKTNNGGGADASSISRTRSVLNLTSSTLFGIYSPTGYSNEREEPSTPWGTGAETPRDRMSIDDGKVSAFSGRNSSLFQKRTSQHVTQTPLPRYLLNLAFRTTLLFCIGMGYGLLVTHLHDDQQLAPFQVEGIIKPSYNWPYLVFWGVAGVGLGSLLPWVDTLWEDIPSSSDPTLEERPSTPGNEGSAGAPIGISQDWNPVVRSIGAFVGIAFAIVSLTLALVNPVLWYLIDRSKPGFLLSAAVGIVGTTVLLSLSPEMMPSPAAAPSISVPVTNASVANGAELYGGLVSQDTIECGTWIISVLFCSCVCFGNIGRRLALKTGRVVAKEEGL